MAEEVKPYQALQGRRQRLKAYLSMIFVDHGFFRYVYLNFHRLGRSAFRSAQPAPHHIARYKRAGVRTVVNLRGSTGTAQQLLEMEACERLGLAYREVRLRSRDAPDLATLEAVEKLLNDIEYPAVFHCKSGADRAGMMSALYMVLKEGASGREAKKQLSLWFGHFSQGPTGVLDAFWEAFIAAETEAAKQGTQLDFMTWARTRYDRKALLQQFKASDWATVLTDRILRRE